MEKTGTGFVYDALTLLHDTGIETIVNLRNSFFHAAPDPHPSASAINARIKEFLDGTGMTARMQRIVGRQALDEEITTFHTAAYLEGIRLATQGGPRSGAWGMVDEDTNLSPESFDAALWAVGGALNAVQAVMDGQVHNAYALLRPPGHHATSNQALGYCLFNNVVLAANYARKQYGLKRILILDWDVHHGNGTQEAFYRDSEVLFLSLHQDSWFPGSEGRLEESGEGAGRGYTINVPLPPATGNLGYLLAFERLVKPIVRAYQPELILLSAGQDGSWMDPLARMMLTMDGYREMAGIMVGLAEELCGGRLVMLQEGGYSVTYVPYCTVAAVGMLVGYDPGLVDLNEQAPEVAYVRNYLSQESIGAIERARDWYQQWWEL